MQIIKKSLRPSILHLYTGISYLLLSIVFNYLFHLKYMALLLIIFGFMSLTLALIIYSWEKKFIKKLNEASIIRQAHWLLNSASIPEKNENHQEPWEENPDAWKK